ncbi:MAG: DUF2628 domain-containing protein [Alphaproteobacteria bacterium]|jgi:uncharacterized membrane protein YcjF (UPF0283 family)|nr:DUF2628 domain-containing protein [Alphaproteobacteria bacterium]
MAVSLYTYHMKPGETPLVDAVAVREGFSFWAFLFGALWALYHGLWLIAVVLAAVPLLIEAAAMEGWLQQEVAAVALLLFNVYVGCSGNDWRREVYRRRGWVMAGLASGRDRIEADRRFFDAVAERRPAPGMVPG